MKWIASAKRRLVNIAASLLLARAAAVSIQKFMVVRRNPLGFDDAYMFLRYAHNIRHGLGFSWNLDGLHTYGPTSLLWSFVVLLLSYLPTDPWTKLLLGSWIFSIAAVIALAWAVATNAQSDWLRSILRTLAIIAVPLAGSAVFEGNQFNGMETMLATTLCALFVGLALQWHARRVSPVLAGAIGLFLFLARPESALITVLLPPPPLAASRAPAAHTQIAAHALRRLFRRRPPRAHRLPALLRHTPPAQRLHERPPRLPRLPRSLVSHSPPDRLPRPPSNSF